VDAAEEMLRRLDAAASREQQVGVLASFGLTEAVLERLRELQSSTQQVTVLWQMLAEEQERTVDALPAAPPEPRPEPEPKMPPPQQQQAGAPSQSQTPSQSQLSEEQRTRSEENRLAALRKRQQNQDKNLQLTEEQRERMEANRLAALQKREQGQAKRQRVE